MMQNNKWRRLRLAQHSRSELAGDGQSGANKRGLGRRIVSAFSVSLLSAGILTVGLTATVVATGVIGASSASAEELNGYYTSNDGHSGFCMDPGFNLPNGRNYLKSDTKFGNDTTKVLSWFATHYGPEYVTATHTSGPNPAGGGGYPASGADPRIEGLTSDTDALDVTRAISSAIVLGEGMSPLHPAANQTFQAQLLAFAQAHPAPWVLATSLNWGGPYTPGTTYTGDVVIHDKNGARVPVGGMNISATGQTNVSVSSAGETQNDGSMPFSFVVQGSGAFDSQFFTDDIAGRAPVYQDEQNPGGYQRLMTPERSEASTGIQGLTPETQFGVFLVGKVNETGTVGLQAVYNVYEANADLTLGVYRETIVTSNGDGTNPHATDPSAPDNTLPAGIGFSENLEPGLYYILEVQAPVHYFPGDFCIASPFAPPINPFCAEQLQPINNGMFTNVLFANQPRPGRFGLGKIDTYATVATNTLVPLAGAQWRIDRCVDSSCASLTGETITTGLSDSSGTFFFPPDQGYFAVGYYLITEIVSPSGFLPSSPQITQILPEQETDVLFGDIRQPTVSTNISRQTAGTGDTIFDTITVGNTGDADGSGLYESNVIYVLVGPVAPIASPDRPYLTCEGVTFPVPTDPADPLIVDTQAVAVHGDGNVITPTYTVQAPGCYTYTEFLVEFSYNGAVLVGAAGPSSPGVVNETVLVFENSIEVSTQISDQSAELGSVITDDITITGSSSTPGGADDYVGPVLWTLYGPVASVVDAGGIETCVGANWAGAPVADSGSISVTADGTYTTPGYTVAVRGCYTYIEFVPGSATNAPAGPSQAGDVTETTLVAGIQPLVSTQISAQSAFVGDTITDDITVENSQGYQGPVNWTLYGPVAPLQDASGAPTCEDVDWTGAPTAATGSITANGDGTYTTAGYQVTVQGCYTYSEYLVGDTNTLPAGPSVPGAVTETTLALPHFPAVSTQVSQQTANVGDTINDAITVTGSGSYDGVVEWTLLGPVAPGTDAEGMPSCVEVDWEGAAIAATGSVTVNGDGTYITADYTVSVEGCFTYTEFLPGNATTAPAGPSTPGAVSETVLVFKYQPEVSTQVSQQTAKPGDVITDTISVTGSHGYQGPVIWVLLGPVAPNNDADGNPTCVGVSWFGSGVAATGFVIANGDGDYVTEGYTVAVLGCYTYTERLVGNAQTAPAGPTKPGIVSETVLVTPYTPEVSTQISKQSANVGDTIHDTIVVAGSGGYQGPVNWTLYGPVTPTFDAAGALTCAGLNWATAPVALTGSVTANGDGSYLTVDFTVTIAGCYTYTELLVGNDTTTPAGPSTPGQSTETVLVYPPGYTPPGLAVTGSDIGMIALGGFGLVVIGGAAAFATRRRGNSLAA